MEKFIFTKDFSVQGKGKSPNTMAAQVFTPFKKGDIIEGSVTDNTPVDGEKFVTFDKNGLVYVINLAHQTRGGVVDSPLVEFTPSSVTPEKDNSSTVIKPPTPSKTFFTPTVKNILFGASLLGIVLLAIKVLK